MEIEDHYSQLLGITGVAVDLWTAYRHAGEEKLPQADIVHDRFDISQLLKFNWLINEEHLNEVFAEQFNELRQADLKVSRA